MLIQSPYLFHYYIRHYEEAPTLTTDPSLPSTSSEIDNLFVYLLNCLKDAIYEKTDSYEIELNNLDAAKKEEIKILLSENNFQTYEAAIKLVPGLKGIIKKDGTVPKVATSYNKGKAFEEIVNNFINNTIKPGLALKVYSEMTGEERPSLDEYSYNNQTTRTKTADLEITVKSTDDKILSTIGVSLKNYTKIEGAHLGQLNAAQALKIAELHTELKPLIYQYAFLTFFGARKDYSHILGISFLPYIFYGGITKTPIQIIGTREKFYTSEDFYHSVIKSTGVHWSTSPPAFTVEYKDFKTTQALNNYRLARSKNIIEAFSKVEGELLLSRSSGMSLQKAKDNEVGIIPMYLPQLL